MTHFPVTTQAWRGVWQSKGSKLFRRLKRACDWHDISWLDAADIANGQDPECIDCKAYAGQLFRLDHVTVA